MRPGTCKHFRGIQHERCDANLIMRDMRSPDGAWPCLQPLRASQERPTCPLYQEPTREEIAQHEAEIRALLDKWRGQRGECSCGVKITSVRQVGSCVYADPCGHRIGQGDARVVRKKMGLP